MPEKRDKVINEEHGLPIGQPKRKRQRVILRLKPLSYSQHDLDAKAEAPVLETKETIDGI